MEPDDEVRLPTPMDRYESDMRMRLQIDYGHSWVNARVYARVSRQLLERELCRVRPLIILTGLY